MDVRIRPADIRPPDGGVVARRAVVRWAWRLFRREWRQQALVLALLILVVGSTIVFATAAYNTTGVGDDADFGTADHLLTVDEIDAATAQRGVAAAEEWFGEVDVIASWERPVPGSVETIEFRAQDPDGPFSEPMLALQQGRYPSSDDEIAVTDGVAETFQIGVGDTFDLDGPERTVVGLVENPSDLNAEFALVAPTDDESLESVTILVGGSAEHFESFPASNELPSDGLLLGSRSIVDNVVAAAAILGVAQLGLVLVALVAAASFVAVAQRRLRQLGMLASIGATQRHLRLVVVANGAVLGIVAAVLGGLLGVAGWIAVAPRMESAVGYRIDPFNVPWWLIVTATGLVVVAATAAAWWPARAVARVPITNALSGRPQGPQPAHQSAGLAAFFVAVGVVCLAQADRTSSLLLGTGAVAIVIGVLLVSPFAIRLLSPAAGRLPIAMRLALRDLSRYQARAAAALAGISLSLGIPAAIVITASAAEQTADMGNVSDSQMLVWTRDQSQPEGVSPYYTEDPNDSGFSPYLPRLTPADLEDLEGQVDRITEPLDDPTVIGLDLAMDPAVEPTPEGRIAVTLAEPTDLGGGSLLDKALLYVGTPELLEQVALDLDSVDPDADVLTAETGDLWFPQVGSAPEHLTNVEQIEAGYSSLPSSFITPDALERRGWDSTRVGWLVEADEPLTTEQIAAARELAADAGLLIETREHQEGLIALRWQATAVGTLLALCVLAMTVGLIRSAAERDLRTLTATGATSGIRRTLTAATAGGLAFLGAALGTAGAYVGLAAGYRDDLGALGAVPVIHLLAIVVGVPLVAAGAGWLLAGREPTGLARQAIE